MSALSAQLRRLSTPGNLSFRSASRTKTPSLLFSEEEAADLELETFYAHGVNGLEELVNINPVFQSYQDTLFGDASKSFERTQQTLESNKKLDEEIWRFLLDISPYILLKPAQKALEWLIHTFRIYAYNTDALVACALPYHNTAVFVRIVRVLPLKDPSSRWHWMRPAQQSESPLSRFTILQQCQSVPAFLQFVCSVVERAVGTSAAGHDVLVAFYTGLCVGLLNACTTVTEQLLTRIVPSCVKSLRSNHSDLRAGAYMILGQLVVRATLEGKVLETFVDSVCRHVQADLLPAAMACLACLFQTQQAKFSKRSIRALCYQPEVVTVLEQLAAAHEIAPLLARFLPGVLRAALSRVPASTGSDSETTVHVGKADYLSVILQAIHSLPISESLAGELGKILIESYLKSHVSLAGPVSGDSAAIYTQISQVLNQRYPTGIDHALATVLAAVDESGDDATLQRVHDFMEVTLCGTKNQVLLDRNSARILTFNHPQANVRCLAVKQAQSKLTEALSNSEVVDSSFFASAFVERLSDEDAAVCKCVLELNTTLIKLVDTDLLCTELLKLLQRCRIHSDEDAWCQVGGQAAVMLGLAVSQDPLATKSSLFATLSLLQHLWLTQNQAHFSTTLLQSLSFALRKSQNSFLSTLCSAVGKSLSAVKSSSGASGLGAANRVLLDWMVACVHGSASSTADVVSHIRDWCIESGSDGKLQLHLASLLLSTWLRKSKKAPSMLVLSCCQKALDLMQHLVENVKSQAGLVFVKKGKELLKATYAKDIDSVLLSDAASGNDSVLDWWSTVLVLTWAVKAVIGALATPPSLLKVDWWSRSVCKEEGEQAYLQIVHDLLPLLLDLAASVPQARCKRLLSFFTEKQTGSSVLIKALCMIWAEDILPEHGADEESEENDFGSACLCLEKASDLFQSEEDIQALVSDSSPAIPSLVCGLCHHSSNVRQASVAACKALAASCAAKKVTSKDVPLLSVVDVACQLSVQIAADPQVLTDSLAEKMAVTGATKVTKQWSAVMKLFVELAVCNSAPLHVKVMLLTCLEKVPSKEWLPLTRDVALHTLRQLFSETSDNGSSRLEHDYLRHLVQCQLQAANITNANHLIALETVETTLKECRAAADDAVSACNLVLPVITPSLFLAFPTAGRRQLLSLFLDRVCVLGEVRDAAAVHSCLMQFPVDGEDMLNELKKPSGVLSAPEESSPRKGGRSKRRKLTDSTTSHSSTGSMGATPTEWQRAVVLMELLQNGEHLTNTHILMPHLFRLLAMSIEADDDMFESSEYTKQLLLSGIHSLCRGASSAKHTKAGLLKAEEFNVECIVRCVRASSNPQTHHHALLLLATAANMFPDRVVHNIMAIFTFMGANLLRMDDSYSFEVIQRTIQTVIPALVQAGSVPGAGKGEPLVIKEHFLPIVMEVMRVFADAWPHMPVHRIHSVFEQLTATLGAEGFLHYMLELLVQRYIMQPGVSSMSSLPSAMMSAPNSVPSSPTTRDGGDFSFATMGELDFPVQLCLRFDISVQLSTLLKIVQYIGQLPMTRPETGGKLKAKKDLSQVFDVAAHTEKHLQLYKITLLTVVEDVLNCDEFVIPDASSGQAVEDVHEKVLQLLEEVVTFANRQTRLSLKQTDANLKHCLRSVCSAAFKVVSAICDQLSVEILVDVVLKLSAHKATAVQNKALELLNAGLQKQERRPWPAEQEGIFVTVAERLTAILETRLEAGVGSESSGREELVTCQSAFISLKLLTCQLAARNAEPMLKVAKVVLDILSSEDCCPQVCASAIICYGEAVACLGSQLIAELPRAIKALVAVLKSSWSRNNPVLLQISAVTALGKMIVHLPSLLGKQLKNILRQLVHSKLCVDKEESSESGRGNLLLRAQAARTSIAVKVPGRVLFPAIQSCFQLIAKPAKIKSILALLSVFSRGIQEVAKSELMDMTDLLTKIILEIFDFIASRYDEFTESNLTVIQDTAVKCFITLVMRCSESTFRPMFKKICNWADHQHQCRERMLVYFYLTFSLADRLKGLFTLFGAPVVDCAGVVLDAINMKKKGNSFFTGEATNGVNMSSDEDSDDDDESEEEEDSAEDVAMSDGEGDLSAGSSVSKKSLAFPSPAWKCQRLANLCTDSLLKLFAHDTSGKLVHKQLFEEIMPPLVDQLDSSRGSVQDYQQYITDHLVPCISQLSVVIASVPLWKDQNTLLLHKTTSASPRVRFATLSVLKELFTRLSEEYVALLPETIPALAELLEDESPEVEKHCHSLMKVIEEITGESAQSYF